MLYEKILEGFGNFEWFAVGVDERSPNLEPRLWEFEVKVEEEFVSNLYH